MEGSFGLLLDSWGAPGAALEASWFLLEPSWRLQERSKMPPRAFGKRPRALKWLEGASKSCKTRFCSNFGLKKKPLNLQNL